MKIDQQNISGAGTTAGPAQTAGTNAAALNKLGGNSSISGSDFTDQADLSGVSRAIQTFNADRSSRVSQLSSSVQNDSYKVDPALVSHSLVSEALSASAGR